MKPARVSAKLRQIAAAISKSKFPSLPLVLEDLRLLLAALEQPMRYFAFPTKTNASSGWDDPMFLEGMVGQAKDDFSLAQIYGDVVGIHPKDDFYWVIEIEADDEELAEEIMELGIAKEVSKPDVSSMDIPDPILVWWEQFGRNMPGVMKAYPDTCLPGLTQT